MNILTFERKRKRWHFSVTLVLLFAYLRDGQADMFSYMKMKKIITAMAVAKALGGQRRPTIIPIPIPIPIPIQQNDVIRIPAQGGGGSGGKTYVATTLNGQQSNNIGTGIQGGGSFGLPSLAKGYGSSSYGYALSGLTQGTGNSNKIINLSNMNRMQGNVQFANVDNGLILGSNNPYSGGGGGGPYVIRYGGQGLPYTDDMSGGYDMDYQQSYSAPPRIFIERPRRRRRPYRSGRRRTRSRPNMYRDYTPEDRGQFMYAQESNRYRTRSKPSRYGRSSYHREQQVTDSSSSRELPVGETYG